MLGKFPSVEIQASNRAGRVDGAMPSPRHPRSAPSDARGLLRPGPPAGPIFGGLARRGSRSHATLPAGFVRHPGFLDEAIIGARFLAGLPRLLRHPVTLDEARTVLARRLAHREDDFLRVVRHGVYDNPRSPYRKLLARAGCERGDLERLVRGEGVEGALRLLLRGGVYLTVEELKGRRPVLRPGLGFTVSPGDLANPRVAPSIVAETGGSSGPRMHVASDLTHLRDRAVNVRLLLSLPDEGERLHAVWGVPGSAAMNQVLQLTVAGARVVRWFSQIDARASGLHPRYRLSARIMRVGGRLAGVRLPRVEYVSPDDPLPIVRWMAESLAAGQRPHLLTFSSSAVRLCREAVDAGVDLRGVRLWVGGEPATHTRLEAIRAAGAHVTPRCGSRECSIIAHGCAAPAAPDDLHLFRDLHGVIQAGEAGADCGLPPGALLFATIRPTAPLVLLNASLGDQAALVERDCGCPLGQLGWTTHLHTLRSFNRLTGAGMTFLDADVLRVLEEVLPARFGGMPSDYQLCEETEGPRPRLRLLVHPRVGPLDPAAVVEVFLGAIGQGSGVERVMGHVWRDARIVDVERRPPLVTAAGKIAHHVERAYAEPRPSTDRRVSEREESDG